MKKTTKKLSINKETVSSFNGLTNVEMAAINGGNNIESIVDYTYGAFCQLTKWSQDTFCHSDVKVQ